MKSSLGNSRNFHNPPKLCNQSMAKIGGLPVIPHGPSPALHSFQSLPKAGKQPAQTPAKTGVNGRPANSRMSVPRGRP